MVTDSINTARQRGASDDLIVEQLLKQNPQKAASIGEAKKRGANSSVILDEIIKQNQKQTLIEKPKEGFFNTGGEGVFGRLRVPEEELKSTNPSILKAASRPILNLLFGLPAETAKKTLYDIPKAAYGLGKELETLPFGEKIKAVAGGIGETFGSILSPLSYLGKVELGAVQKGLEKMRDDLPYGSFFF